MHGARNPHGWTRVRSVPLGRQVAPLWLLSGWACSCPVWPFGFHRLDSSIADPSGRLTRPTHVRPKQAQKSGLPTHIVRAQVMMGSAHYKYVHLLKNYVRKMWDTWTYLHPLSWILASCPMKWECETWTHKVLASKVNYSLRSIILVYYETACDFQA